MTYSFDPTPKNLEEKSDNPNLIDAALDISKREEILISPKPGEDPREGVLLYKTPDGEKRFKVNDGTVYNENGEIIEEGPKED